MCERCAAYPFLLRFIEDVDDHVPGAVHHLGDLLVHALQHGQVAVGSDRLVDGDGGHALLAACGRRLADDELGFKGSPHRPALFDLSVTATARCAYDLCVAVGDRNS